jgi:hypothetical protein
MSADQIFLSIAALLGGAFTISAAIYAVYRVAKRIDAALGLDKDGRTVADRLERVEHQLWENGGSSLADRVNRIDKTLTTTATEVRVIKEFIMTGTIPAPEQKARPRAVKNKKAS